MRLIDAYALVDAPTIDQVKHEEWIYSEVRDYPVGYNLAECSGCGWYHSSRPGEKYVLTAEEVAKNFSYCPNCGAKMKKMIIAV